MSKARLVITAVVMEGRSQSEVARCYGVSQPWISRLIARYRVEGEAAFEPRSKRPHRSPRATDPGAVEGVLKLRELRKELDEQGLDAGAHTICWHLQQHHNIELSAVTVWRILSRAGQVTVEPTKRPKSSYVRFEADPPNETWNIVRTDFTHVRLATGRDVEVLNFLDDHSRMLLACVAYARVTGPAVATVFLGTVDTYGVPASVLSDNGRVFTTRSAGGGKGGRNAFEKELRRLDVVQKNSTPNHPQTCGKVERLHQTLNKWLTAQPEQPTTIAQLQSMLDAFRDEYNRRRPHRS